MTAMIGNYVGLVPTTASVEFPFVGNSALHDGFPFVGNLTCSSDELLLVRNQIYSSGEMLSVGNFTGDSDQILQRHDFVENDPSPSKIALVLHEITKTRECMNTVINHLDALCDCWAPFVRRERGIIELTEMLQFPNQHHQHIHLWNPWNRTTGHKGLVTSMVGSELCVFITKPMVILLVSVLISLHQAWLIWTSTGGIS